MSFPRIRVALADLGIPRFQSTPRVTRRADYDRCLEIFKDLVSDRDTETLRALMERRVTWPQLLYAQQLGEKASMANARLRKQADEAIPTGIRGDQDLYFIRNPLTGLIKIGVTESPSKRHRNMEYASGMTLDLLRVVPHGGKLERQLHRQFAADRVLGEWFLSSPALEAVISEPDPAKWAESGPKCDSAPGEGNTRIGEITLHTNDLDQTPRVGLEPTTTRLTGDEPFGSAGHVDPKGGVGGGTCGPVKSDSAGLTDGGGSIAGQPVPAGSRPAVLTGEDILRAVVAAWTSSKPVGENAPAQRLVHREWPELADAIGRAVMFVQFDKAADGREGAR